MPDAVKDQQEHVAKSAPKADKQVTCLEEKGSLICTKQSLTIESLLPDEEDLFSGVPDELGCTVPDELRCTATANSDDEDFDLFSSNGGMELGHSNLYFSQQKLFSAQRLNRDQSCSDYLLSRGHPNVVNNVKGSKLGALFEDDTSRQYIDQSSLEVLNCDSSVSNDKLYQIFGNFGEIEEICGTTHHRRIKFYDIRATESAINGLNDGNMLQGIKLDVNYTEHAKSLMHQSTHSLMQDQLWSCQNPNSNSLPHVATSCLKDEYIYGVHSPLQINCGFTNSFPSTVGMPSAYNQVGHMTDQTFYPQTLPVNCKADAPYDSLNFETVGFIPETNDKHLHMFGSYGSPMEHMFGGSSRIARSALRGHHMLNCSNSFQNHHLSPVIWSYSPPFNNDGVCAHANSNPIKCSFRRPRGRVRRTSYGRHENVSCHTDEKKFELDIERVLRGEDTRTTLMIKNIPNKYSSAMLLAAINENNQGTYDFVYLPLDFKNKCNMGYAFINMTDTLQIVSFYKSFNGKKWGKFHSGKVACLAYARIQGKAALIAHFQESSLLNEDKCCHPILFTTDGPNAGNQEAFPLGPNIQSRRHKRSNTHKVNANKEMLSTSLTGSLIIT